MAKQFQYGAVLSWKGFVFDDGGSSDKLLVVLGAKQGKNLVGVLTTSQPRDRPVNPGCHIGDGYFSIKAGTAGFTKDTWVELYRPQEISMAEIVKGGLAGDIWAVENLPDQLTNEIRNCLKRSPDITGQQLDLLE